jgi:MFS family permease
MCNAVVPPSPVPHPETLRFFWRNYLAHGVEGGLYIGGLAFVHTQTVLPRMVQVLGGPDWLVALAPVTLTIGFILPGVFLAHWIERLTFVRPFVLLTGVAQRLPYLLAALVLFVWGDTVPGVAVPALVLTPLLSGLAGGVSATAWKELIAKTIPARRRASLWAIRFVIATLIGFAASRIVSAVLRAHPGARGCAILHLLVFGFVLASFGVFLATKEPRLPPRPVKPAASWQAFVRSVPDIVAGDRRFARYLAGLVLYNAIFVMLPFLGIQALRVAGLPDSALGALLFAQMLGGLAGNLLGGVVGDVWGGKRLFVGAIVGLIVLCACAPLARTEASFQALFILLGLALSAGAVAVPTLDLEISPLDRRVGYQATIGVFQLAGVLVAATTSGVIRSVTQRFAVLSYTSMVLLAAALVLIIGVAEPRPVRL